MKDFFITLAVAFFIAMTVATILSTTSNAAMLQKLSSIYAIAEYNRDYVDFSWSQAIAIIDGVQVEK